MEKTVFNIKFHAQKLLKNDGISSGGDYERVTLLDILPARRSRAKAT